MNRQRFFKLKTLTLKTIFVAMLSVSHFSFAVDVVTDEQVKRVAKIAKLTKTDITITKERVTVTVHGGNAKAVYKVKKSINGIMKKKGYSAKKNEYLDDSEFASENSVKDTGGFKSKWAATHPPRKSPPQLGVTHPISSAKSDGENGGYY